MNCLGINGRGNTGSDLSSCCAGHGGRCSCWSWHGNHVAAFNSDSCAFACTKPQNCRAVWTVMARASVNTTAESSSSKCPTNTATLKPSITQLNTAMSPLGGAEGIVQCAYLARGATT